MEADGAMREGGITPGFSGLQRRNILWIILFCFLLVIFGLLVFKLNLPEYYRSYKCKRRIEYLSELLLKNNNKTPRVSVKDKSSLDSNITYQNTLDHLLFLSGNGIKTSTKYSLGGNDIFDGDRTTHFLVDDWYLIEGELLPGDVDPHFYCYWLVRKGAGPGKPFKDKLMASFYVNKFVWDDFVNSKNNNNNIVK